jgi:anhydro-N-acetylmuramic acid kinase
MDGLDMAFCHFRQESGNWSYSVIQAETIPYTAEWLKRLKGLPAASALDFTSADYDYGHLLGCLTRDFISRHRIKADFIASHGHTVFHRPEKGITSQLGNGAAIKAETGLPVICDFRSEDLALGGQGAPLVPAGDMLLFRGFDACLNLGGFANISYNLSSERIAYDICPVNIVLNELAGKKGKQYDINGEIASWGSVDRSLLRMLNNLPYYSLTPPKSLGREWVFENISPLLENPALSVEDLLCTFCSHIAFQISQSLGKMETNVLVSGGGALNKYLMAQLRSGTKANLVTPDLLTINFKEAIIFAFLGVLRWRNENNCFRSVTGARLDHCSGAIY